MTSNNSRQFKLTLFSSDVPPSSVQIVRLSAGGLWQVELFLAINNFFSHIPGWYVYFEVSNQPRGTVGNLVTLSGTLSRLPQGINTFEMSFWYLMYGANTGTLRVIREVGNSGPEELLVLDSRKCCKVCRG